LFGGDKKRSGAAGDFPCCTDANERGYPSTLVVHMPFGNNNKTTSNTEPVS
jgi:hypothetical protein